MLKTASRTSCLMTPKGSADSVSRGFGRLPGRPLSSQARDTMQVVRQRLELVACNYDAGNPDADKIAELQCAEIVKDPTGPPQTAPPRLPPRGRIILSSPRAFCGLRGSFIGYATHEHDGGHNTYPRGHGLESTRGSNTTSDEIEHPEIQNTFPESQRFVGLRCCRSTDDVS